MTLALDELVRTACASFAFFFRAIRRICERGACGQFDAGKSALIDRLIFLEEALLER